MAEIFPNEGLDLVLGIVPKGGTTVANTYMGLFTSQTASTVPSADAVGPNGTGTSPSVEVANANAYARQTIAAASWGANSTSGSGRRTTAGQVSFPASTGSWGTVNGFFLANSATFGAGAAYYYANFSDTTAVNINAAGYTLQVTPYWHLDG
jgi:hypothetical protein